MNSEKEISEALPECKGEAVVTPDAAAHARMDPELKAKWVAALLSGEYAQTQGRLKTDDGYCCLGVLCVVAGIDTGASCGHDQYMPLTLVERAKIPRDTQHHLAMGMNDRGNKTFPEIAAWIEANL